MNESSIGNAAELSFVIKPDIQFQASHPPVRLLIAFHPRID